jgi:hypothetical protein
MQQIEHGVLHLCVGVVIWRRVDVGATPSSRHRGEVPTLTYLAARYVLEAVVLTVGLWHLDRAVVKARSEERACRRIRDHRTIHRQRVVVEAHDLRRGRRVPQSIWSLAHIDPGTEPHSHFLRLRCGHSKHDPIVRVDAGIRCPRDVQRIWSAVGGWTGRHLRGREPSWEECEETKDEDDHTSVRVHSRLPVRGRVRSTYFRNGFKVFIVWSRV